MSDGLCGPLGFERTSGQSWYSMVSAHTELLTFTTNDDGRQEKNPLGTRSFSLDQKDFP